METTSYLLSSTHRWRDILIFCADRCDSFIIVFPDDEMLSGGKTEFLALAAITVGPTSVMAAAIAISGPFTPAARELLLQLSDQESSVRLWSYELRAGGQALLRVEDFSLCLLFASPELLQAMRDAGIDADRLEPIDLTPQLGTGVSVVRFTPEAEQELQETLCDLDPEEPEQ